LPDGLRSRNLTSPRASNANPLICGCMNQAARFGGRRVAVAKKAVIPRYTVVYLRKPAGDGKAGDYVGRTRLSRGAAARTTRNRRQGRWRCPALWRKARPRCPRTHIRVVREGERDGGRCSPIAPQARLSRLRRPLAVVSPERIFVRCRAWPECEVFYRKNRAADVAQGRARSDAGDLRKGGNAIATGHAIASQP